WRQALGLGLTLALLCVVLALGSPYFLTSRNLLNVLVQSSINTVLAVGMTFVIMIGGIDLSVGSALALTAVVVAVAVEGGAGVGGGMAAGLLCALAIGATNGLLVARLRLAPFIVTLGTLSI